MGEPEGLRESLAGRYEVGREIGRGGMATVYLARDLKHDRPVALKVLHAGLAPALGLERFQREIRFAARLQHPHILTVLDSGAAGPPAGPPLLWFTMPWVQGESLRHRMEREGPLPVDDAVRIAREAAEALAYAHEQGVIHRDIKPENILLSAGHALVADFGIALAVRGHRTLTDPGVAVGTPGYMSPEQAIGERKLDARSDVYSLGIVLFEMLTGQLPFEGETVRGRRFPEKWPGVLPLRPEVPAAIDAALRKALAPGVADRFADAGAFARSLGTDGRGTTAAGPAASPLSRHLFAGGLGLALLLGLGLLLLLPRSPASAPGHPPAATGPRRLAVLPFENLGRPEDDYFADGITDEIRGKLAGLPGLQVTASSSSGQYKRTGKTPQEIGRELGVDYLLIGKVRWEKDGGGPSRVRVSPELVQAATATTRWQQPFDAALTDVFQVQAEVASRVAGAMDVALEQGDRLALGGSPTASLPAYDLYLQGNEVARGIDQMAPAALRRALGFYRRATELDSTFALAWAQLSRTHSYLYYISVPSAAEDAEARAAAQRALALAPGLAEAHLALGDYYHWVRRDNPAALAEYSRGRALAPSNSDLLKGIGLAARSQGNWELSQASFTQALALDPRSMAIARRLAYNLLRLRRTDEALAAADRALALDPHAPDVYETKAMVLLQRGDLPGARRVVEEGGRSVDSVALVQYVATYFDLFWVLTEAQQRLLLTLSPEPFDGDRETWGLALAGTWLLRGDTARARAYGDSARIAGTAHLREAPRDAQLHALQGTALAYAGRKAEAIREGRLAVELVPPSVDANAAPYMQHQLARIYLLVGEPERALDLLGAMLGNSYYVTPGWLRVDPEFAPLRGNPRFQRLVTVDR